MSKTPPPIKVTIPGDSGSSTEYGLSSNAAGASFTADGLPGLSGSVKGTDLIKAFIAAGNGQGDPSLAAAIQQALAIGGYYGNSTFIPHPGRVMPEDIKAFAQALNVLADSNAATPAGSGAPQQGVAQFLTNAAVTGAENGTYASQVQVHQYQVTTPNAAQVASEYEKVAQQLLGRKPTAQEKAAFVQSFTSQYVGTQRANNAADYAAATQKATLKAQGPSGVNIPLQPPVGPGTVQQPAGLNQPKASLGLGAGDTGGNAADLDSTMQSLQDVINANSQQTPTDQMVTANETALPDLATSAENFARNTHPGEAAAGDVNDAFQTLLGLMGTHLNGV